jgi:hypothetical protein
VTQVKTGDGVFMEFNIPPQYLLIGVTDIIIVVVLIAFFIRSGRTKNEPSVIDTIQLKKLKASLEEAMSSSTRASRELQVSFEEKVNKVTELLEKLDEKERALKTYIRRSDERLKSLESAEQKSTDENSDPYIKAVNLVSRGFSSEDIQKQSGLSLGEIDLIKQLARRKVQ